MNNFLHKAAPIFYQPYFLITSRSYKPWILFFTTLVFLFGLVLFAQVSQSAAQGVQSQVETRYQLRESRVGMEVFKATETPQPLQVALNHATRTPRPTSTPPAIPPPADPTSSNLMITLAAIIVLIILVGIWINRRRVL